MSKNGRTQDLRFVVVHPLDAAPDTKPDMSRLGRMPMTRSVRLSLIALRAYLIVMTMLVLYHVVDLAETLARHAR